MIFFKNHNLRFKQLFNGVRGIIKNEYEFSFIKYAGFKSYLTG